MILREGWIAQDSDFHSLQQCDGVNWLAGMPITWNCVGKSLWMECSEGSTDNEMLNDMDKGNT